MSNPFFVIVCSVCGKIRTESGQWVEACLLPWAEPSFGYCPECLKQAYDTQVFPRDVNALVELVKGSLSSAYHEFDDLDLSKLKLTSELNDKGFIFHFPIKNFWQEDDEIRLGLYEFQGVIFIEFRVPGSNHGGMVSPFRQVEAKQLYDKIVDRLLAL